MRLDALAFRGYRVIGIDRSKHMLKVARQKIAGMDLNLRFLRGDIHTLELRLKFDAVISMFGTIGFHESDSRLATIFSNVANHLNPNGLFIFDSYYAPALHTDPPRQRIKVIRYGEKTIIRFAMPTLSKKTRIVKTDYKIWVVENMRLSYELIETHIIRSPFPQELKQLLQKSGFRNVKFYPFPSFTRKLSKETWHMVTVASKV